MEIQEQTDSPSGELGFDKTVNVPLSPGSPVCDD